MPSRLLLSIALVLVSTSFQMARAQGTVNAFVQDSNTRCINPNRDYIWIKMLDLRASKSKGLLTENASIGILINTTALGASNQNTEPIKFPSLAQADVKKDAKGSLVLPIQLGLVTQLALGNNDMKFAQIDFDVKLVEKKQATQWGAALETLASLANDLPLPPSPYTTGARYFSKYTNAAIQKSLETEKPETQDLKGRTVLQFKPQGNKIIGDGERCVGGWAETGVYLIVDGANAGETEDLGFIDIKRLNDYCWRAEFDAGLSIKWTKKLASGCDKDGWKSLSNPYIPLVVQAVDTGDVLTGKSISGEMFKQNSRDVTQSLQRCQDYGVPDSKCLSAPKD